MAGFERLSPIDRTFLDLETENYHQHIGATLLLDAAPLTTRGGHLDADRIREYLASRLHRIPRYRQRLATVPMSGEPVWVDDHRFNLRYHVRHTALPPPGSERQLKRLAGRIMSQKLDRGKPLWEMWIVEGVEGDRFAIVTKTHHCMIDGIAGIDLMTVLLTPEPVTEIEPAPAWEPDPPPAGIELAAAELLRLATTPAAAARSALGALLRPRETLSTLREGAIALAETLSAAATSASRTPLNRPLGPHRRFDWTRTPLERARAVKRELGGTVNDVVLATVAGALGRFLRGRGLSVRALEEMELRAMVPVSIRPPEQRGRPGNHIALWAVPLPVALRDPRRRLAEIRRVTEALKHSRQALGAEILAAMSEWTVLNLVSLAARAAYRRRTANLVVTNVPGPQVPLYLLESRVRAAYPMLNLLENHALGVALISYAGQIHWGLMADWDLAPDLHDFTLAIDAAFDELCEAAGVKADVPAPADPGEAG